MFGEGLMYATEDEYQNWPIRRDQKNNGPKTRPLGLARYQLDTTVYVSLRIHSFTQVNTKVFRMSCLKLYYSRYEEPYASRSENAWWEVMNVDAKKNI